MHPKDMMRVKLPCTGILKRLRPPLPNKVIENHFFDGGDVLAGV